MLVREAIKEKHLIKHYMLHWQNHRELAREAVRKSLVLLKNGENGSDPVLPLPKNATKILVTGTHAHNLGYQCGGWTLTWQGQGGNNITKGMSFSNLINKL